MPAESAGFFSPHDGAVAVVNSSMKPEAGSRVLLMHGQLPR
ncbi:MAG: hypothetical protein ACO1NO_01745 [Burkholderiaceae bacterium]